MTSQGCRNAARMPDDIFFLIHEQLQPVYSFIINILFVIIKLSADELAQQDKSGKSDYQIGKVNAGKQAIPHKPPED
jgi:hypothetical protein